MGLILKELKDKVGTITFNNDEKRNCLSKQLLLEFIDALEELKRDKEGSNHSAKRGARVWSAGFDISELPDPGRTTHSINDPLEIALRAVQISCTVIAMIEGSVLGVPAITFWAIY
jgi:methylmalonyl-CoA decarboxylase